MDRLIPLLSTTKNGSETFFRIKPDKEMDELFNEYASQWGIDPNSMRFLVDGVRNLGHHTPEFLKLEGHDQILCVLDQDGGNQIFEVRSMSECYWFYTHPNDEVTCFVKK